jgi:NhaP-type Na+/H+ or K+/H+ antiporter
MLAVLAVVTIVTVTALAPRVGVAAPLILVALGIGISFLPFVPAIEVGPELILAGVLPPLLYSVSVNVPTMDFRRDLATISALSVLLVVASAVVIGLVMHELIPDLPLPAGIALGAIVSPTDAVATSIVRKLGVSSRLVTVLEGESLLNDATALVLLRSAVAAIAASVSVWDVVGDFVWAVAAAVVIGGVVGHVGIRVRGRLDYAPSSVAISLVTPFVAFAPAEHIGASGLVAAVTAGLVTGHAGAKYLDAEDRMTSNAVWRTLELLLESGIFLLMGLEVFALVEDLYDSGQQVETAVGLGVLAICLAIALRTLFVLPVVWWQSRRRRHDDLRNTAIQRLETGLDKVKEGGRRAELVGRRLRQRRHDLEYLAAEAFGRKESVVLVWAGMRGAVTVAAAQSLPAHTPHRSLLVLTAFVVAAGSLLVQGSTLSWIARRLGLSGDLGDETHTERDALRRELRNSVLEQLDAGSFLAADGNPFSPDVVRTVRTVFLRRPEGEAPVLTHGDFLALRLAVIEAQRRRLLELRDVGQFSSAALERSLRELDADQLSLELRAE